MMIAMMAVYLVLLFAIVRLGIVSFNAFDASGGNCSARRANDKWRSARNASSMPPKSGSSKRPCGQASIGQFI